MASMFDQLLEMQCPTAAAGLFIDTAMKAARSSLDQPVTQDDEEENAPDERDIYNLSLTALGAMFTSISRRSNLTDWNSPTVWESQDVETTWYALRLIKMWTGQLCKHGRLREGSPVYEIRQGLDPEVAVKTYTQVFLWLFSDLKIDDPQKFLEKLKSACDDTDDGKL